jgi:hypothetical protein
MGKKTKSNKPAAAAKNNLPGWHESLPKATVENVSALPQVDHGWICTLIQPNANNPSHPHGILAILDITNRVRGEGTTGRFMNVGPCPNPQTEAGEIAKAIMATMIAPAKPTVKDAAAYYQPRRPAWILMEKDLESCVGDVAEILAEAGVVVKLNTPQALAQEEGDELVAEDNNGRMATWDVGLAIGATVDNVSKLSQEENQIWKCSMTMLQDETTGAKECFLAVEDITEGPSDEQSYPLGFGPCPAATVNPDGMVRALFATMLSPRAREGGYGEARRPGRVILDKPLEPWLEHVQTKVDILGVSVEI